MPGALETMSVELVLLSPQRNAYGATPPEAPAVHVIWEPETLAEQEAASVSALARLAKVLAASVRVVSRTKAFFIEYG